MQGSAGAWEELFSLHYPGLRRSLRRLTRNDEQAADFAQDTFVRLLVEDRRRLRTYDSRYPFGAYLCTIGCRLYLSYRRKLESHRERIHLNLEATADMLSQEDGMEGKIALIDLEARMEDLTIEQRLALRLAARGMTYKEIGIVLGIGSGGVGALIHRAGCDCFSEWGSWE